MAGYGKEMDIDDPSFSYRQAESTALRRNLGVVNLNEAQRKALGAGLQPLPEPGIGGLHRARELPRRPKR